MMDAIDIPRRQTVIAWSLAFAMALLALTAIPLSAIAAPVAALALFFGAYVAMGERSVLAAVGFPLGLLSVVGFDHLIPIKELTGETMAIPACAGLIGLTGTMVANIVNRRGGLRTAFEALAYSLLFPVAFFGALFVGYFLGAGCQLFLPPSLHAAAGALVICVTGALAGALIGICMSISNRGETKFPGLRLHEVQADSPVIGPVRRG